VARHPVRPSAGDRASGQHQQAPRPCSAWRAACRKLERFAYISTVYVAGQASGVFDEAPLRHREGLLQHVPAVEIRGRAARRRRDARHSAVIVRLSSLIGDSRSGHVRQFNYVHQLMKLLPQNVLPIVPGSSSAPIDLIPTDWAIPALAHVVRSGFQAGAVFQVCAGPDRKPRVSEMIDLNGSSLREPSRRAPMAPDPGPPSRQPWRI